MFRSARIPDFERVNYPKDDITTKVEKPYANSNTNGTANKTGELANYSNNIKYNIQNKLLYNAPVDASKISTYEAVKEINQIPIPKWDNNVELIKYNQNRANISHKALQTANPPKLSDYKSLDSVTAAFEFNAAKTYYNNQVSQLTAIYNSAITKPLELPLNTPLPLTDAKARIESLSLPDFSNPASIENYNKQVAIVADASINGNLPPQKSDFSIFSPIQQNSEYLYAKSDYDSQITALKAISEKAKRPIGFQDTISPEQYKKFRETQIVKALGIELPENASPEDILAVQSLIDQLPTDLQENLFTEGKEISFEKQFSVAPFTKATIAGSTKLSEVTVGANFDRSQSMTVELELSVGAYAGKPRLTYVQKKALAYLQNNVKLSDNAKKLMKAIKFPVGVEYGKSVGGRLTTSVVTSPEKIAQIKANQTPVPNAFDPDSMEPGTSVLIKGQEFERTEFAASYKLLNYQESNTNLSGFGIGVEKFDKNIVRVYAGDINSVENATFFGLGKFGIKAGLGTESTAEHSNMKTADFDMNTEAGIKAYRQFLTTGKIPSSGVPGVIRSGISISDNYESSRSFALKIGGFGIDNELSSSNINWQDINYDEGSKSRTGKLMYGANNLTASYMVDKNNNPIPNKTTFTIMGVNLNPVEAADAEMAITGSPKQNIRSGNQDVQLEFTENDLLQLKKLALEKVTYYAKYDGEGVSPEQFMANRPNNLYVKLAKAENTTQMAILITKDPRGYFNELLSLGRNGLLPKFNSEAKIKPISGNIEIRPHQG